MDVPRPVDLSLECCTMLEKLMLAQAQECFYEKATRDNKSPGIVARCGLLSMHNMAPHGTTTCHAILMI